MKGSVRNGLCICPLIIRAVKQYLCCEIKVFDVILLHFVLLSTDDSLPEYDPRKKDLPARSDFVGAISWLKAIRSHVGEEIIFALDEALMCQGNFLGRNDEYIVWAYGDNSLSSFNGIVLLGNRISPCCVKERDGLRFTDFNRTLCDSLDNENILDMQGITEALSNYYFEHNGSFDGIIVPPGLSDRFESLANDAIGYYTN